MKKSHSCGGQALTEYILLVCVVAVGLFGMIKLFSKWTSLTFRQHVSSLGYTAPLSGGYYMDAAQKRLIELQMRSFNLQKEINSRYGK